MSKGTNTFGHKQGKNVAFNAIFYQFGKCLSDRFDKAIQCMDSGQPCDLTSLRDFHSDCLFALRRYGETSLRIIDADFFKNKWNLCADPSGWTVGMEWHFRLEMYELQCSKVLADFSARLLNWTDARSELIRFFQPFIHLTGHGACA